MAQRSASARQQTSSPNGFGGTLETRVVRVALRDLVTLDGEVNARFMPPHEYEQLVANLRLDGQLTSAPLVAVGGAEPLTTNGQNRLEVLSGNHRVRAAIDAGIEEADCIEVVSPLSLERKRAIQLAHNRIAGQDDSSVLQRLWDSLGIAGKVYTGIQDADFKIPGLDLASLSVGGLKFTEIVLTFLPPELEAFEQFLERTRSAKSSAVLVAAYADFDAFLITCAKVKGKRRLVNTALAIAAMVELAAERLDQIEAEETDPGAA